MTSMTEQATDTAKVARHARILASVLDALPDNVETPTHFEIYPHLSTPAIKWLIFGERQERQRDRAAAIVRAVGGHWDKQPGDYFRFQAERNGVRLEVVVDREQVCERVVTGTREITRQVPAPDAPMVEVTETVEDVEWVCAPLLTEATA